MKPFIEIITTFHFQCLNSNGVPTSISMSYQYRIKPEKLGHIVRQFQNMETYEKILYYLGTVTMDRNSVETFDFIPFFPYRSNQIKPQVDFPL